MPRGELPAAVALNSIGFNIARSVGPAIGGVIVALLGSQAAFLINTLSYLGLIVVLLRWKRPVEDRKLPPESIASAMVAGLRYVRLSPAIRSVLLRSTVFGITASAVWALMPLIARDQIGGGPSIYGLLLGAFGVGAVLGAGTSTRLRARSQFRARGGAGDLVVRHRQSGRRLQRPAVADDDRHGAGRRRLGAGAFHLQHLDPAGGAALGGGPRGRHLSDARLRRHGAGCPGCGASRRFMPACPRARYGRPAARASLLLTRAFPVPATDNENLDPQPPDYTPTVHEAMPYRAGPVVVTIEYRVAKADAPLSPMRCDSWPIRQRNGARRWTLMVDVAEPELWVERYESPTWLDYLRLRYRGTVSDRAVWDARPHLPPRRRDARKYAA